LTWLFSKWNEEGRLANPYFGVVSENPALGAVDRDGFISIVRQHCIRAMARHCGESRRLFHEVMRLSLNSDCLGFAAVILKMESNECHEGCGIQQGESHVHLDYLRLNLGLEGVCTETDNAVCMPSEFVNKTVIKQ
jgi:hypothetical protein